MKRTGDRGPAGPGGGTRPLAAATWLAPLALVVGAPMARGARGATAAPAAPAAAVTPAASAASARPFQEVLGFEPGAEQSLPRGHVPRDWHWWWHYNKDAYLQLRTRIFEGSPTTGGRQFFLGVGERVVEDDPTKLSSHELKVLIVPPLLELIEEDLADGATEAALMALAKIGPDGEIQGEEPFLDLIVDHLDHSSKFVREQAVLALGVLGDPDSLPLLTDLLLDGPEGRASMDDTQVPREARARAAWSLGLLAWRNDDPGLRREVVRALVEVLEGPQLSTRDVKTACMNALGLAPLEVTPWEPPRDSRGAEPPDPLASRRGQIRWLVEYLGDFRHHHELVRAHAPVAIARLLPGTDPRLKDEVAEPLLDLVGRYADPWDAFQQSAVLALGEIGDADGDQVDEQIRESLERMVAKGDQLTRRFALVMSGRVASRPGGGAHPWSDASESIDLLLQELGPRGESRMRAWAALGLGVMAREWIDSGRSVPEEVLEALREALEDCRTPLDIGAYALAIGLARDLPSLPTLEDKLELFNVPGPKGLVALSMGMIGHRNAEEPLLELLEESRFDAEVLELTAIALALLEAEQRVPLLLEMLEEAGSAASEGPIVSALGLCADRRAIPELSEILEKLEATNQILTATAVALGNIADKDRLLWRSHLTRNASYWAAPPTMTGVFAEF